MIVVADTTPLNYLILIGEVELLSTLYENVLIPKEVHRELMHSKSPPQVRAWAASLPAWCDVREVNAVPDDALDELDAGERDAILLALDAGVNTLLMDETEGRREAIRRHLHVTGTVAVLEKAAQHGWIDFRATLLRLEQTNFRLSARVRDEFIQRNP
jgi:predicted nucleic acid-binding protein